MTTTEQTSSVVVTEAPIGWLRARLINVWLVEHGAFDEDELGALAAEAGVPSG